MPTIIDELIVALGLDASKYKSGKKEVDQLDDQAEKKRKDVNKQNDKEQRERERKAKQGEQERKKFIDETTGSIANLGRSLAGAVLGFGSLAEGLKYLGGLSNGQAALGRTATRLGVDPATLNIWGKAVEFAGGKAEDATETIAALAQQFSTLKTVGGTPGPLLQLLTQRGVAFRDAKGELLDVNVILQNLSKSMAGMSAQDRSATLARAGVAQGLIDLFNETAELQAKQLADAREFNRVTALAVANAQNLKSAMAAVDQSLESAGTRMLDLLSPKAANGLNLIADKIGDADPRKTGEDSRLFWGGESTQDKQLDYYRRYGDTFAKIPVAGNLVPPKPGSAAARNNNPGNIEDSSGKLKVYATLAEGQAAQRADIEAKLHRGLDTIAKIITAYEGTDGKKDPNALASYIARAERLTGKDRNATLTDADITNLVNAMTAVESGIPDSAMRGTPRAPTPDATGGTNTTNNATASNNTTVTAPITINPPAGADPTAIANQTASALNRKITVAQANAGQS